ncbi:MAG: hypothetical protein QW508_01470 [Conexivisphaerales archaeon]
MVSRSLLVKAYSIPYNLEVNGLIEDYMRVLNSILDELWKNIVWKRKDKRLLMKDKTFGKRLSILKGGPIPSITWTQQ